MSQPQSLAIVPEQENRQIEILRDPKNILEEAAKAATALKEVISKKTKPVLFNGEQYIEFEDWQTLGKFYGIVSKIVDTKFVEFDTVKGFEARAVAIHVATGQEISAAEAMCLNDEPKWSTRSKYEWKGGKKIKIGEEPVPLFQIRSMAQTRACAKAMRNVLAWVVVLAGYKPTPAEEIIREEPHREEENEFIDDNQRRELGSVIKETGLSTDIVKAYLFEVYKINQSLQIKKDDFPKIIEWIKEKGKKVVLETAENDGVANE